MTDADRERAVVRVWPLLGFAAKDPDGNLQYETAETEEDVRWALGSRLIEDGWTIVQVEIREIEPATDIEDER